MLSHDSREFCQSTSLKETGERWKDVPYTIDVPSIALFCLCH
jgi:hypothetical protein